MFSSPKGDGAGFLAPGLHLHARSPQRRRLCTTHRVAAGKVTHDLFEPEAVALLAAHTAGNRRNLMNLATMLLLEEGEA
ncbi:MAG: hypothetical protein QNK37_03575 [Acidobacteriota bacterium]|nr:hypothetical protein [Acidobacteriota bacterium]